MTRATYTPHIVHLANGSAMVANIQTEIVRATGGREHRAAIRYNTAQFGQPAYYRMRLAGKVCRLAGCVFHEMQSL